MWLFNTISVDTNCVCIPRVCHSGCQVCIRFTCSAALASVFSEADCDKWLEQDSCELAGTQQVIFEELTT